MPFSRSKQQERVRRVTVEFEGESGWVEYRPGAFTPTLSREVQAAADKGGNVESLLKQVELVLVDWDVELDGDRVPPTSEVLAATDMAFLGAILQAIGEDLLPNARNGGSFASG